MLSSQCSQLLGLPNPYSFTFYSYPTPPTTSFLISCIHFTSHISLYYLNIPCYTSTQLLGHISLFLPSIPYNSRTSLYPLFFKLLFSFNYLYFVSQSHFNMLLRHFIDCPVPQQGLLTCQGAQAFPTIPTCCCCHTAKAQSLMVGLLWNKAGGSVMSLCSLYHREGAIWWCSKPSTSPLHPAVPRTSSVVSVSSGCR